MEERKECLRVVHPPVQLRVIHGDKEICFIYKSLTIGIYPAIRMRIEGAGLRMPTASETASLVYSAFQNPKNKYSREIVGLIKDSKFITDTGFLETKKGFYVKDHPQIKGRSIIMNESELEKELVCSKGELRFDQNRIIRFTSLHSISHYSHQELMLLFDRESIKIEKIGENFEKNTYLRIGGSINPANVCWGSFFGHKWLDVCAGDSLGQGSGFTIGIQESEYNR